MAPQDFEPLWTEDPRHEDHHACNRPSERSVSKWSIGWFTPISITVAFIAGVLSASAHYIIFWRLNNQDVDSSIPQSWVTSISTALGRVFSLSLSVALGLTFTQLLWNKLRKTPTKVGTIDAMFMMQANPLQLVNISIFKVAPILWLAAAFLPIIPLTTVFPPGAIVVVASANTFSNNVSIPTYDFDYRGKNDSYFNLAGHALFMLGSDGEFRYSKPYLSRVAKATAMSGSYLTTPTSCGSNCTYEITIPGPEFDCTDGTASNLPAIVTQMYGNTTYNGRANSEFDERGLQFIAVAQPLNESKSNFVFELQWNGKQRMSCTAWHSEYTLMMNYTGGLQETSVSLKRGHLLNMTYLAAPELFYKSTDGMNYPGNWTLWSGQNVSTAYRESNVHAVLISVTDALSGAISDFGSENLYVANTIILETPLASYSTSNSTAVNISLNANILQSLLQNTTISLLSLSNTNISTQVTTTTYVNQYAFAYPLRLILPYALSLLGTFIFIVLGAFALVENGVAARTGGFLQILCTTRGSPVLDEMVWGAGLGGDKNVSKELKDLVVRYGELRDKKGVRAGFGVGNEVTNLVKGRNYG